MMNFRANALVTGLFLLTTCAIGASISDRSHQGRPLDDRTMGRLIGGNPTAMGSYNYTCSDTQAAATGANPSSDPGGANPNGYISSTACNATAATAPWMQKTNSGPTCIRCQYTSVQSAQPLNNGPIYAVFKATVSCAGTPQSPTNILYNYQCVAGQNGMGSCTGGPMISYNGGPCTSSLDTYTTQARVITGP